MLLTPAEKNIFCIRNVPATGEKKKPTPTCKVGHLALLGLRGLDQLLCLGVEAVQGVGALGHTKEVGVGGQQLQGSGVAFRTRQQAQDLMAAIGGCGMQQGMQQGTQHVKSRTSRRRIRPHASSRPGFQQMNKKKTKL